MTKSLARGKRNAGCDAMARPDGHALIRERNRQAILRGARELFVERGYDLVSVRDITQRAGVALGTFYNHFDDKEALFRKLVDLHVKEVTPRQRAIRRAAKNLPEWVEGFFRNLFTEVLADPASFELFRRNGSVIRSFTEGPAAQAGLNELREDVIAAIDEGLLAPIDPELVITAIVGLSVELSAYVARRGRVDPEDVVQFATRLLLHGLDLSPTA